MYNRDLLENQYGYGGIEYISDTLSHVAPKAMCFCTLIVIAPTVLSAITPTPTGNTLTGETIPAGTILNGQFTSITLTSGKLIAYKGV